MSTRDPVLMEADCLFEKGIQGCLLNCTYTQVLMCNAYPHAHKYSQVHGKETHSTEQVVTPLTKVKILAFRRTYCQFEYYNWKLPEKKLVILFELLIYSYHYGLIKYILQT